MDALDLAPSQLLAWENGLFIETSKYPAAYVRLTGGIAQLRYRLKRINPELVT